MAFSLELIFASQEFAIHYVYKKRRVYWKPLPSKGARTIFPNFLFETIMFVLY